MDVGSKGMFGGEGDGKPNGFTLRTTAGNNSEGCGGVVGRGGSKGIIKITWVPSTSWRSDEGKKFGEPRDI